MMENLVFQDPWWFWAMLALPVIAVLRGGTGRMASIMFSSTSLLGGMGRKVRTGAGGLSFITRLLILAAVITALARPQIGEGFEELESTGIDIVLAVDVSQSMLARDFSLKGNDVTRLKAAKAVIEEFIKNRPYDRIGLIVFAGYPYLVSPLTLNHDWLLKNLAENVQMGRIEDGTAIGSAIGMSVNRLRELKDAKSRIVILLTDGVNNQGEVPPATAAEAAASYRIKVYTVGIGSDHPVTIYRRDANDRVVRNFFGQPMPLGDVDPVDAETLKQIAEISEAKFFRAKDTQELIDIYEEIDQLEKTTFKLRKYENYQELFYWPLLVAMCLLALEIILANTKFRRLP